jgi:hypothetical protein
VTPRPGCRDRADIATGRVERGVGHLDELVDLAPCRKHAQAGGSPAELRSTFGLGPLHGGGGSTGAAKGDQDHELVPSDPVDGIGVPNRRAKRSRQVLKRGVTGSVTVGVVDLLQPVEVDHRYSDVETGSVGAGDGTFEVLS